MNATLLQLNGTRSPSPGSRKVVGLERHYRCGCCGEAHLSWSRIRSCPECGESLTTARIRRAAVL